MNIEDIKLNIIRYNLDIKSRKKYYIYNRMYLYAILFHIHNWSLSKIGDLFNVKHDTVLNALRKVEYVQHYTEFHKHTALIQAQFYFLIPPYKNERGAKTKQPSVRKYEVCMEVTKAKYINYLKGKDPELIYEAMWMLTLDKLKSRIGKVTIPTQE
jgi:hypothetical protein